MRLDRAWIAEHIPHQGSMCLLDRVLSWDGSSIECASGTHRAPDHPLRAHGRLGSACLIEYAAQTMAVHGALLRSSTQSHSPFGLLTSVRALELLVDMLDGIEDELHIRAERQHSDARGALYDFQVHAGERRLAQGRATLLLDEAALAAAGPPT
jgi:predicted hotdog family 3-hydroxylacyl-ACP dehydratase